VAQEMAKRPKKKKKDIPQHFILTENINYRFVTHFLLSVPRIFFENGLPVWSFAFFFFHMYKTHKA